VEPRRIRRLLWILALSWLASFVLVPVPGFFGTTLFQTVQLQTADYLFSVSEPPAVERAKGNEIRIVAIDDRSLDELGNWQAWPRSYHAKVIDALTGAGARVIVFDVLFSEQGPDDAMLADAMKRSGRVIQPITSTHTSLLPSALGEYFAYRRSIMPTAPLVAASAAVAHALVEPESDGVVRTTPLAVQMGETIYPSISLAAVSAYLRRSNPLENQMEHGTLAFAGRQIPVDANGRMTIHYIGKPSKLENDPGGRTFQWTSYADVLRNQTDLAVFKDKIVFIGLLGATGFADDYWTPVSTVATGKMDGVEIHANAAATILAGGLPGADSVFLTRQDATTTFFMVLALGTVTAVAMATLSIWLAAVVSLLLLLVYDALFAQAWWSQGIIPNLLLPSLGIIATVGLGAFYRVIFEEREQRYARRAMGVYLSPAVMEAVLHDPGKLRLGGEKKEMTVLFSDIRGFTTLSEKIDPQVLVKILNEYLTAMSDVLFKYNGVLDKYMGDAIMAFWGAPVDQPDHAVRACNTALDMVAALERLNVQWGQDGVPPLNIGIGLNTGAMSVGNMGSDTRFDYTVMGDAVNLGSRLEGLNKEYGTNILISDATLAAVDAQFTVRFIDLVAVKGKIDGVAVYELLSRVGEPGLASRILDAWENAVSRYREQKWEEAAAAFNYVLRLRPGDGPAQAYLRRCTDLATHPPVPDWNGVYVMQTK